MFGVVLVLHSSVRGTLLSWPDSFVGKKWKKDWRATPMCLFQTLWMKRNRRAFEDLEKREQTIKLSFMNTFVE